MCIKVQYGCIFYPPKHIGALCNSLKNLKTLKGPYSGPRSWSQTQWPWSFQQHISPGFFMTTLQSLAQQFPTWNNRRIPQTKTQYLQGQNIPHTLHKSWPKTKHHNSIKQQYNRMYHNLTSMQKTTKNRPRKIFICNVQLFFFSLLSFCYLAYWFVSPWGTCFTWLHPHRVAF